MATFNITVANVIGEATLEAAAIDGTLRDVVIRKLRVKVPCIDLSFSKSEKHKNIVFLNVCCVMMLYVFMCRSVC